MVDDRGKCIKTEIKDKKWIQLGCANNKYFSSTIQELTQKKKIRGTTSLDGKMLYDPREIKDDFVLSYKSLMGTSAIKLPGINADVTREGSY